MPSGKTKHGHCRYGAETATYNSWHSMLKRCNRPEHWNYARYGGRGITVCDRWKTFENFLADMGERPSGKTLDRQDNALGYSPGNCRWSTHKEQHRNKRSNRLVSWNGKTLTIAEWTETLGLSRGLLRQRLNRGWSVGDALATPSARRAC